MSARPGLVRAAVVLALAALALLGARAAGRAVVAARIRHAASGRGLSASWHTLALAFPLEARVTGLALTDARGDTLVRADSLVAALDPWSLLVLHPRPGRLALSHAWLRPGARAAAAADTLAPEEEEAPRRPRAEKLRREAESLARLLLAPARRLPRLMVRDVTLEVPPGDEALLRGVRLAWLDLDRSPAGVRLRAAGSLALQDEVSFDLAIAWDHDDRLAGGARFVLASGGARSETLAVSVDGALAQDRRAGVLRLADTTRVRLGRLPFTLGGALQRAGPQVALRLAADGITRARIAESLPRAVLGPLEGLAIQGSFDYRLGLDLDLARPDSVDFSADVIPHGLALDAERTTLDLLSLDQPFVARIHLPHDRMVERELSSANPYFRPLEALDSLLVHAVITNEDGAFFRHRGFNTEAIKLAIAENLRAGAYRRGAGTITMQLARNLWLGHARTLSRKAQEVVLAWVLEHLTGLSKRRLLEIYLNIIEWGPGVHGAGEAARWYFDEDAAHLTVDEALFLTTVIPAPAKWRYRFAPDGSLRPFERAQMHFIGRAMIAKGWLAPESLPERDSLRVELRGPAREVLFPPDSSAVGGAAPGDSAVADARPAAGRRGRGALPPGRRAGAGRLRADRAARVG
ncbi:MAG: transglycosylase domain-containing protein [Candidatus Eisenbacteria bacterium]|nr:transglycosylase domain-containing protein [Candidatus Eisenbacteria bacterium]